MEYSKEMIDGRVGYIFIYRSSKGVIYMGRRQGGGYCWAGLYCLTNEVIKIIIIEKRNT